jgi:hypothetical protein
LQVKHITNVCKQRYNENRSVEVMMSNLFCGQKKLLQTLYSSCDIVKAVKPKKVKVGWTGSWV